MRPTRLGLVIAAAALVFGLSAGIVRAQQAAPAPGGSAAPAAAPTLPPPQPGPDDPRRHKFAVQQFLAWQQGAVDRTVFTDQVNGELSDEVLNQGTQTLANMGGLQSVAFVGTSHAKAGDVYVYKVTCEHGSVNMDFALTPDGKISLIFFE
ncbi:MAG TPA: hypothetical protein VFN37_07415 [Candidatus Baltobacteraceae bacterium]|nr:hypothetical protein [Candidatus Baltobacteraceae bacterium]